MFGSKIRQAYVLPEHHKIGYLWRHTGQTDSPKRTNSSKSTSTGLTRSVVSRVLLHSTSKSIAPIKLNMPALTEANPQCPPVVSTSRAPLLEARTLSRFSLHARALAKHRQDVLAFRASNNHRIPDIDEIEGKEDESLPDLMESAPTNEESPRLLTEGGRSFVINFKDKDCPALLTFPEGLDSISSYYWSPLVVHGHPKNPPDTLPNALTNSLE